MKRRTTKEQELADRSRLAHAWRKWHAEQLKAALEAVIACCAIPMTIAEPSRWKKFNHLHGGDKEPARQRALQLFKNAHAMFAERRITAAPRLR